MTEQEAVDFTGHDKELENLQKKFVYSLEEEFQKAVDMGIINPDTELFLG